MKIDPKHERLIQDVLDGTASPAEVEELNGWLNGNELGRTRMRELEGIFSTLGRVPAAEAPAGLKEGVLNVLQSRATAGEARRSRPHSRSILGFRARLGFVFAAGLAAGAVIVGIFTGAIPPVAPGSSGVSGTMMPPPSAGRVQVCALGVATTQLQAMSWRTSDGRRVSLIIRSVQGSGPAEIELSFDASRLSVRSFDQDLKTGAVESRPGRILVRGQGGEFSFDFVGVDASAPIHIQLRSGGESTAADLPAREGAAAR